MEKTYQRNLHSGEFTPLYKAKIVPKTYPTPAIPRYYRYEMYRNLSHYLKKKDKKYLQHFSYWFQKWKKNFPLEYETSLDQVYGFSEYQVAQKEGQWEGQIKGYSDFDLKNEAGRLGLRAGLVLNFLKINTWPIDVKKGSSALEILSAKYKPIKESIDHKAQNQIFKKSIQHMSELDPDGHLDAAITMLANPQLIRMARPIKIEDNEKAYQVFFNFVDIKGVTLLQSKNGVTILSEKNPCNEKPSEILHIKKLEVDPSAKILKLKSGKWICNK